MALTFSSMAGAGCCGPSSADGSLRSMVGRRSECRIRSGGRQTAAGPSLWSVDHPPVITTQVFADPRALILKSVGSIVRIRPMPDGRRRAGQHGVGDERQWPSASWTSSALTLSGGESRPHEALPRSSRSACANSSGKYGFNKSAAHPSRLARSRSEGSASPVSTTIGMFCVRLSRLS
jgi:hypothetical protein